MYFFNGVNNAVFFLWNFDVLFPLIFRAIKLWRDESVRLNCLNAAKYFQIGQKKPLAFWCALSIINISCGEIKCSTYAHLYVYAHGA